MHPETCCASPSGAATACGVRVVLPDGKIAPRPAMLTSPGAAGSRSHLGAATTSRCAGFYDDRVPPTIVDTMFVMH
ncbi:MAG TPA: hypothetical protein VNA28_15970 [Solirubrobacteraceae bacterium]|nr:hypothetical protein [Solirubrobacteraceae bacterium]